MTWREKNLEHVREYKRRWRQANAEKCREHVREYQRRWRQANAEKCRASNRACYRRKLAVDPDYSIKRWQALKENPARMEKHRATHAAYERRRRAALRAARRAEALDELLRADLGLGCTCLAVWGRFCADCLRRQASARQRLRALTKATSNTVPTRENQHAT